MKAAPRFAVTALAALAIVEAPRAAFADTYNYCSFANTTGLTLNNDASKQGSLLELTPNNNNRRGSAFLNAQFPFSATTSFYTFFRFRISPNAGGADGMAFVIQSGAANVIGSGGGGLGYAGIGQSVAVEFDTFANGSDPNGNHIAVLLQGDTGTHIAAVAPAFSLVSDQERFAWVDYDGPTKLLQVYLANSIEKPAGPLISTVVDLGLHLGPFVRAGFTGATGGQSHQHAVLEWHVSNSGFPCCVSAPGAACADPFPACGPNGVCVECVGDADCGPGKPRCDVANAACVSCLTSADCLGNAPVCKGKACVPCAGAADCVGSADGPACSPTGACVACIDDATCSGGTPRCDVSTHECVECVKNADCGAATPACDPFTQTCVGCMDDSVCSGAKPICDVPSKQCIAGCHVVNGKDSCGPGMMCDKQDGTVGACDVVSTSSSGMASSSSSGSTTGAGGAGGTMGSGGGPGTGGAGGAPGPGVTTPPDEKILPLGAGCWCGVGTSGSGGSGAALSAAALIAAALGARRRRAQVRS